MSSFVKKIKQGLGTPRGWFILLITLFAVFRCVSFFKPILLGWDASVYIGMGRYLSSGGAYGVWEYFRPPLLPILFSIAGFLHVNPLVWAKLLTVIAGLGSLCMVYRIGERFRPYAGVYGLLALGIAPLFSDFAQIPMTEMFGILFALCIIDLVATRKNPFVIGVSIGVIFLLRFPYGLLLPIVGLVLVTLEYERARELKKVISTGLLYTCGFLVIALPFFILNKVLYGDYLAPIKTGQKMITGALWLYSRSSFYYAQTAFIKPALFFGGMIAFFWSLFHKKVRTHLSHSQTILYVFLLIWIVVFLAYFNAQPHKETRYIIAVFAPLALLSGVGLSYLSRKVSVAPMVAIIIFLSVASISQMNPPYTTSVEEAKVKEFYSYLSEHKNARVISASPIVTAYAPVKVIVAYDSWDYFNSVYNTERQNADFLLIDSCQLHVCTPGDEVRCNSTELHVLSQIEEKESIVYDETNNQCHLLIAKINK